MIQSCLLVRALHPTGYSPQRSRTAYPAAAAGAAVPDAAAAAEGQRHEELCVQLLQQVLEALLLTCRALDAGEAAEKLRNRLSGHMPKTICPATCPYVSKSVLKPFHSTTNEHLSLQHACHMILTLLKHPEFDFVSVLRS